MVEFEERWVRLKEIVGDKKNDRKPIIPISSAHWWHLVKEGKAPVPTKLSERCTVWKLSEVMAFAEGRYHA